MVRGDTLSGALLDKDKYGEVVRWWVEAFPPTPLVGEAFSS